MVISSRTPEGSPNRCPVCGNAIRIEPSQPTQDAPCPHRGHLLWFVNLPSGPRIFDQAGNEHILRVIAEQMGVREDQLAENNNLLDLGADSLDLLELEMELSGPDGP